MTADMKAAMERAKWVLATITDPGRRNLAAAFLEAEADLARAVESEAELISVIEGNDAAEALLVRAEQRAAELARRLETTRKLNDIRAHESRDAIIHAADLQRRLEEVEAATIERCAEEMRYCKECAEAATQHSMAMTYEIAERRIRALSAQPNAAAQVSAEVATNGDPKRSPPAPAATLLHDLYVWQEQDSVAGNGEYAQGLMCGVEDRGFQKDGYSAMRYGYDAALERVAEYIDPIIAQLIAATERDARESRDIERGSSSPEPAPSAAPDAALPGLEAAADDTKLLDWLDDHPTVIIRSGKQHIRPLIRAEIERRRKTP